MHQIVTHHPPISAYIYTSPENNLLITGEIRPISKFLGNSAATIMEGGCDIQFIGNFSFILFFIKNR